MEKRQQKPQHIRQCERVRWYEGFWVTDLGSIARPGASEWSLWEAVDAADSCILAMMQKGEDYDSQHQ